MAEPIRTEGYVFVASSLDGFIARADDDIDWLNGFGESNIGCGAFMQTMDGIIMGRRTFEKVLTLGDWPHRKPVVVVTRSRARFDLPPGADVRLSKDEPADLLASLAEEGWNRVCIDGGEVARSYLEAGLVCEITVTHAPILLGAGRSLFAGLDREIALTMLETRTFRSGLTQSRYRVRHDLKD